MKLSLMKSTLGSNIRIMSRNDALISCYDTFSVFRNQDDLDFFTETLESLQSLELNLYIKEVKDGKKTIDLCDLLKQNENLIKQRNNLELELSTKNQEILHLKENLEKSLNDYNDEKKKRLELEISFVSLNLNRDQQVQELQIENDRLLRKMRGEVSISETLEKSTSLLSLIE